MKKKLNWGVLAPGKIARRFATGVRESEHGELVAVGSRSRKKAETFADQFEIPNRYGSYERLLDDSEVQAVYIATPHPLHALWAVRAAEAGKHILCEKPLAINHAEAMAIVEAASRAGVFLMEAFMYRCSPQTDRIVDLIRNGSIGEIGMVKASFGFHCDYNLKSRLLSRNLGGGGILDVGCYAVSMARLVAGVATGRAFANPITVEASGKIGRKSKVDDYAAALLTFPEDIIAQVSTGVQLRQENTAQIFGTEGNILVPNPWTPTRDGGQWSFTLTRSSMDGPEEIEGETPNLFGLEADRVAESVAAGKTESTSMSWKDTLGNMDTLDRWREAIGLEYPKERITAKRPTIHGRPLRKLPEAPIPHGRIEGVDKPISRLVMGSDSQPNLSHASVMFDDFIEQGGNCFDTAYLYGRGLREKLLGQWIKNRGIREDLVLIVKGAHSPLNFPEYVTRQLFESLENLKTDYADIYFLHRDNPDLPVGDFVEVLNEHYRAGRIKAFGGSNWTTQRIDEANAYADKHGLQRFTVWSNNFSLARMVKPVWAGCIAASDPKSRKWLEKHQMPLFPWSSQARGFFTDRAGPDKRDDAQLVRSWYSRDNFKRRERAIELARAKGVLPINIALAYVLCQPFPTFPIFGPRLLSETRSSIPAVHLSLTTKELQYLNLEKDNRH